MRPKAIRKTIGALFARPPYLQWYCRTFEVPGLDAQSATSDFFRRARSQDISPVRFFDPSWFRSKYQVTGANAFLSYLLNDRQRLARPSPLFAPRWYSRRYRLIGSPLHPFRDFLLSGGRKSPHPLLDVDFLRHQTQEWRSDDIALEYVVDDGKHRLNPHPLFDSSFYLAQNPDVATGKTNPLEHYLYHGHLEGRAPNRIFNVRWYRDTYLNPYRRRPSSLVEPLTHYVSHGFAASHMPAPGLQALSKVTTKMSEHGPTLYIECLKSNRNIYGSVGHTPKLSVAELREYMPEPIEYHNASFPGRILFLRTKRIAILYTPKCASGSIIYWWIEQMGLLPGAMHFSSWSHDFEYLFRQSREYVRAALSFNPERYTVYKFVRNPIWRAASSFTHFLLFPHTFGVSPGTQMSFNEFLDHLGSTDYWHREIHCAPQITEAEASGKISPHVLRIEDGLETKLRFIESRHGLSRATFESDPEIKRELIVHAKQTRGTTSVGPNKKVPFGKIPKYAGLFTPETIQKIHSLYRDDFDAYGYKPELS